MSLRLRSCVLALSLPSIALSCTETKPPPVTPAVTAAPSASASASAFVETPEAPVKPLRTGAVPPLDVAAPIEAKPLARFVEGGFEIVELDLGRSLSASWSGMRVVVTDGIAGPKPFVAFDPPVCASAAGEPTRLYVRRPTSDETSPIAADVYLDPLITAQGTTFHLKAPATKGLKEDQQVFARWAHAMARSLPEQGAAPTFASRRLRDLVLAKFPPPKTKPKRGQPATSNDTFDWAWRTSNSWAAQGALMQSMDTLTGAESIQQALQTERPLLPRSKDKTSVPLSSFEPPKVERHPWATMLASLGKTPPPEPMADAVPADGWYVRAKDLPSLFRLLDETDDFGSPLASMLDTRSDDRELLSRYETQLGLGRGPLTRAFGPDVIAELAATGSDPYLREGSDLTLLFRVKAKSAFDAGAGLTLSSHLSAHGGAETATMTVGSVTVQITRSKDGAVRQHRATVGDLEVISNSPGGIRRVLDTLAKKTPALSAEADFQYMLARDAGAPADVLAYAGDRFVLAIAGPAQKVAESRRLTALAQLEAPPFAALLFGYLHGVGPKSVDDLVKEKLLSKDELQHQEKDPITFAPGRAPSSSWGTPAFLTPIVDLSPITEATKAERDAYARFANAYDHAWSEYVDPIALRLSAGDAGVTAELRVLPLVSSRSYDELFSQVGGARITAPLLRAGGARLALGVGPEAELRRLLASEAHGAMFGDIGLDWLGEWAMLGVADMPSVLAGPWGDLRTKMERPSDADDDRSTRRGWAELLAILDMPLYAAVQVKSVTAANLGLVALRKMAKDAAPNLDWREWASYRDAAIVRVQATGDDAKDSAPTLYYCLDGDVLLASFRESIIRALIDDSREGRTPARSKDAAGSTQLAIDVRLAAGGTITTLVSWLLERAAIDARYASRDEARSLFDGAPELTGDPAAFRALAAAYLGHIPAPPDGGDYTLAKDGVREPARGTFHAPIFPEIPVQGSPQEKTLRAVAATRVETSIDDEPGSTAKSPRRSLHAKVTVTPRK